MTLGQQIEDLLKVKKERAGARERWLALADQGDPGQVAARGVHLALDEDYERQLAMLVETLHERQAAGTTDLDMLEVRPDAVAEVYSELSDRGLSGLLETSKPDSFRVLVRLWRQASAALTAARRINEVRLACDPANLERELAQELVHANDPEGFERAVKTFRLLLLRAGGDDAGYGVADAMHDNMRGWLDRYDRLTEFLQEMVEELSDAGALSWELGEMSIEDRRSVLSAIDGGLLPQRQVQTEPETRPSTGVQVIDRTVTD